MVGTLSLRAWAKPGSRSELLIRPAVDLWAILAAELHFQPNWKRESALRHEKVAGLEEPSHFQLCQKLLPCTWPLP